MQNKLTYLINYLNKAENKSKTYLKSSINVKIKLRIPDILKTYHSANENKTKIKKLCKNKIKIALKL